MSSDPLHQPLGVFDSGVGGLSVLRAIRKALPAQDCIYVADSEHAPYGDRTAAYIAERTAVISNYLLKRNARAIVVACNTATAVAVASLRVWCPVPVIAMEPAIKPASRSTRSGVVGVLATSRTITGANVARLRAEFGETTTIKLQPCPGLVEQVERGETDSKETVALLASFLSPLLAAGADTIVLGCTHYSFLTQAIVGIVGAGVQVIDPAPAVAKQVARRLFGDNARPEAKALAKYQFVSNGELDSVQGNISRLWGTPVEVEHFRPASAAT